MICKQCGTESRGLVCPRCGCAMTVDSPAVAASNSVPSTLERRESRPARRPPLRLGMVFWQAMALLLPLAYFFFDAFVVLSDKLFLSAMSGNMNLPRLMERLCSTLYESNSVTEIVEATIEDGTVLTQSVSFFALLSGDEIDLAFLLPLGITALAALLCAVSCLMLLLTGGRILRLRSFCNLTLLGGVLAVFAPLVGSAALRFGYYLGNGVEEADVMMQRILPSVEYLCVMGILACALLPALVSLKRIAAYARRQNAFLTAPFGPLGKRSLGTKRALTLLSLLGAAGVLVCFFYLPVSGLGDLNLTTLAADLSACNEGIATVRNAAAAGESASINFLSAALLLIAVTPSVSTVLLMLEAILLIFTALRVLSLKSEEAACKKGTKRKLTNIGVHIRRAVFAPLVGSAVIGALAVVFLLIATPALSHLDFASISETLSVLYLAFAYVRTVSGVGTLYMLLAAAGVLLSYTAASCAAACLIPSRKKNENTPKIDK